MLPGIILDIALLVYLRIKMASECGVRNAGRKKKVCWKHFTPLLQRIGNFQQTQLVKDPGMHFILSFGLGRSGRSLQFTSPSRIPSLSTGSFSGRLPLLLSLVLRMVSNNSKSHFTIT